MRARSLVLGVVGLLGVVLAPAPSLAGSPDTATVSWHAQQSPLGNTGQVPNASAQLVRHDGGISFRISTSSLHRGNAYTLWLVVINNPGACESTPCSGPDVLLNPETRSQVRFAAGNVAGGSGQGTFAGSVQEGELSGWFPGRALEDASRAEVHLVINDHGPKLADHMPGMINSYRGGCSDDSPFPPIFPQSALDDGEPGPNECRLFQAAVFQP